MFKLKYQEHVKSGFCLSYTVINVMNQYIPMFCPSTIDVRNPEPGVISQGEEYDKEHIG